MIDNKNRKKSDVNTPDAGDFGNALEYFIFEDYTILEKLLLTKKNLTNLNDITLLTQDNFVKIRKYAKELTKDIKSISSFNKTDEVNKKYKDKILNSKNFDEKNSDIRLRDLGIEEIY